MGKSGVEPRVIDSPEDPHKLEEALPECGWRNVGRPHYTPNPGLLGHKKYWIRYCPDCVVMLERYKKVQSQLCLCGKRQTVSCDVGHCPNCQKIIEY
jgi:hypothetical protein